MFEVAAVTLVSYITVIRCFLSSLTQPVRRCRVHSGEQQQQCILSQVIKLAKLVPSSHKRCVGVLCMKHRSNRDVCFCQWNYTDTFCIPSPLFFWCHTDWSLLYSVASTKQTTHAPAHMFILICWMSASVKHKRVWQNLLEVERSKVIALSFFPSNLFSDWGGEIFNTKIERGFHAKQTM